MSFTWIFNFTLTYYRCPECLELSPYEKWNENTKKNCGEQTEQLPINTRFEEFYCPVCDTKSSKDKLKEIYKTF